MMKPLSLATLIALLLLPTAVLAQERQTDAQPFRAKIGVQAAAATLFDITDAANNPRLLLDDTGKLTIYGLIESTTGGFKFPDGTTQTTAATGSGGGLWAASGSDIFYNAGLVGIGTSSPAARLDVSAIGSEPSIVTRDGNDYATKDGQEIDFGHWDGTTFTERMAISSAGDVGIGDVNSNVKLNVKNIGDRNFAFNVEKSDGTNLFTISDAGNSSAMGPLAVSGLIESTLNGFKFPDGTTQITAAIGGGGSLWSASAPDIYYNAGSVGIGTTTPAAQLEVVSANTDEPSIVARGGKDFATPSGEDMSFGQWDGTTFTERMKIGSAGNVGIRATSSNIQLNVRNNATNDYAFNVEKSDGTDLFRIGREGATTAFGDLTASGSLTTSGSHFQVSDDGRVGIGAEAADNAQLRVRTLSGHTFAFTVQQDAPLGVPRDYIFWIGGGGNVGIGEIYANTQLNVRNINSNALAFNVEKSDGTALFTVQHDGTISSPNGLTLSKEGDLTLTGGAAPTTVLDHPLDPAQKQLRFTAVEAPERYTFHSGTVVLDASGAATVTLPDWYEASNTDLRYQLTPIGAPGPNLYIARKVQNSRFEIAGGTAGMEVSWQLTATRADAAARARPFEAESLKAAEDRGRYYTPEAHGQPVSLRINSGQYNQQPFEN